MAERHAVQHAPGQIALLQPVGRGCPQPLPVAQRQRVDRALHRGVHRRVASPSPHPLLPGVIAQQRVPGADPHLPARIFQHRLQPLRTVHPGPVLFDLPADRVELVQGTMRAHRPHTAVSGRAHAQHVRVAQRGRVIFQPREHRELPPPRQQMPQAAVGTGQPDAALAIFVGTGPVRPDLPTRDRAVQRHLLELTVHRAAQAGAGVEPVPALFVAQHHAQDLIALGDAPRGRLETAIRPPHCHPDIAADPQAAVGFGGQPIDDARRQLVTGNRFEIVSGPARQAGLGSDPQGAIERGGQIADRRRRQAARVARLGHEAGQRAVALQPVQAALVGAEPDRTVRCGGHAPDRVAADLRMAVAIVETDFTTVGRHHRQAGIFRADPQLIARIHVHAPDVVVAQAVLGAPDAVIATVVAGQAIVGGDPQIAVAILGHAVDGVGWQTIEHGELPRRRRHRLRRRTRRPEHTQADQQRPQHTQHQWLSRVCPLIHCRRPERACHP